MLGPEEILGLSAVEVDALLDRLEAGVSVSPGAIEIGSGSVRVAYVFGDTHGDFRSLEALVERFLAAPGGALLLGLGDYIDRPPRDCPNGSVATALYLAELSAAYPDRVVLLKGNHEAARSVPVVPHGLPEEVDELWGPDVARYSRILGLLERGPWAARSASGAYFAHAGFPDHAATPDWKAPYAHPSEELLLDTVWRDAAESSIDRGISRPFNESDLASFLAEMRCRIFLRGHDPDLTGQWILGDRCLTLHTTRVYEAYGGVLFAEVPLDRPIASSRDVAIEHLPTERREFPPPSASRPD